MYLHYRITALGTAALLALGATVEAASPTPEVRYPVHSDVSAPMRDVIRMMPPPQPRGTPDNPYEIPNILLKRSATTNTWFVPDYSRVQNAPSGTPAPPVDIQFDAITQTTSGCGCLPPDTNGDVSEQHFIQTTNGAWAVYDKTTGAVVQAPTPVNSFFVGFGGQCETTNDGDPTTLWDAQAKRWVISQFVTTEPFAQCVAVSTTSNPLGSYYRYEFQWPIFGDYPKMGVWSEDNARQNAYTLITHDFTSSFQGASLIAMERTKMLVGDPTAAVVRFSGFNAYGVQPVQLSGTRSAPGGACPSFVHFETSTSQYRFWDLCLDWATPANTVLSGPTLYDSDAFVPYFNDISQLGTAQGLDSFGSNTMYRATARAFDITAPTRVSLVVNHVVTGGAGQAAVRWMHFNMTPAVEPPSYSDRIFGHGFEGPALPNTVPPVVLTKAVLDQGTFAPDADSRWMGGIAIDGSGNIGLGYSKSSATINPKIMITGRTASDPAGQMRDEVSCTPGATGSQTSTSGRWGDYASMSVDPVDECRFYFTTEYLATTSNSSWRTRVCSFTFPDCGDPDFALVNVSPARVEVCSATATGDPTWNLRVGVLNGFNAPVTFNGASVPVSTTASFTPNPVVGAGSTVLTLNGAAGLAAGEYAFAAVGTSTPLVRQSDLELGVSSAVTAAPTLLAPVNNATGIKVIPTLSWSAVPGALDYMVEIATDVGFTNIVASATVSGTSWKVGSPLLESTPYFWRVTPSNYCGDGAQSVVFAFTTGIIGQCPSGTTATTVFSDNFQSGTNGWTTDGSGATNWNQIAAPAGSGLSTTVWGIPNNATTSDRGLISPTIAIPANSQATFLIYDTWHNFETDGPNGCYDNATLDIKVGAGAFTYVEGSSLYTDPYDGIAASNLPNAGLLAWCHIPSGAINSIVDMDDYVGQNVQLRFRALADANTVAPTAPTGMYIDNLSIKACTP